MPNWMNEKLADADYNLVRPSLVVLLQTRYALAHLIKGLEGRLHFQNRLDIIDIVRITAALIFGYNHAFDFGFVLGPRCLAKGFNCCCYTTVLTTVRLFLSERRHQLHLRAYIVESLRNASASAGSWLNASNTVGLRYCTWSNL